MSRGQNQQMLIKEHAVEQNAVCLSATATQAEILNLDKDEKTYLNNIPTVVQYPFLANLGKHINVGKRKLYLPRKQMTLMKLNKNGNLRLLDSKVQ